MDLLTYLRNDLAPLMRRREKVALRAVRDVIGAIENAETTYVPAQALNTSGNEFVAGGVSFGYAERVVNSLTDAQMMELARAQVSRLLDNSARYREKGQLDLALTLKAEALALTDRLDAYPGG